MILKNKQIFGVAMAMSIAALFPCEQGSARAEGAHGVGIRNEALLSQRVSLGAGKTVIVDLPKDVSEIVVGDPKVADAIVRTPRKIYIMAAANGQTTIIGFDAAGRQIVNLEVSVGRDVGELSQLLKAAMPRSNISVRTVNEVIILTGEVASAGDAKRAVDIANGFASRSSGGVGEGSGNSNVVNALTVRGDEQVMLKVTVAEVDRKIIKQLGVAAQANGNTLLNGGWGKFVTENPFGINPVMSETALMLNGRNNTNLTLKAFERYGVTRVLAEPTVTAISGEQAKLLVGGEIPVPGSGSCTFSSGAAPICAPGITFKPYGVSLNFTPTVLSEGRISLRLTAEVTEVDLQNSFSYANVAVPGFRSRKNETTVELPSGASIATAGLISQGSAQAISGLPGLLDLPVLGALFRSRDYQRNESELLVVVTPYIARPLTQQEISRPDDGFADASDPQAWLLGRVNRIYASRNNPQMMQNFKGRVGFIHD
jgi:pilus assembly protein CpaC